MTDAIVTQDAVKVLATAGGGPARVTQSSVKVLGDARPPARVTQTALKLLVNQEPAACLSQAFLQVLHRSRPARQPSRQVPIAISMTSEKGIPGDPYWSRVEFLVRSDIGYFDLSRRKRGFSMDRRYGPFITAAQAKFGTTSFHQRTVPSSAVRHFGLACRPDVQRYGIGRKKFTIEGWIRVPAANYAVVLSCYNPDANDRGWMLHLQNGIPTFWAADQTNSAATLNLAAASALSLNSWHHLAIDRDDEGVVRLYVNGAMAASTSYPGLIRKAGARLKMGGSHTNNAAECWLDDVRFTNGVCRYGSDTGFTAPTGHPPFEPRDMPEVDPVQDRYYDLISVLLDTSAGIVDRGPRGVPVYGNPAPTASTSQSQSFYDGPVQSLWPLSGAKIVVPDIDDQNNLGDGTPFTIESIFNYYASQGIVSYDILGVQNQWVLWASASNMRIYFWNGTGWTSVGNAGDNSYNSLIHFAFTYDGKGVSRMYMNGYLVDKTVGVYPPSVPAAELLLGWQSNPGRINEFRLTKGIARWTDDYCIPAHEYFFRPPVEGPAYVPEVPPGDSYSYPYPLPVVNPRAAVAPGSEWLQLSGNIPGRWNKFMQTGGYQDYPGTPYAFHLQSTTRVHTVQKLSIPELLVEDVDAGLVDAVFELDFGLDPRSPAANGCYLVRATNAEGKVVAQRYSRNFSAENWSPQSVRLPLPAGTRAVDIGFLAFNSGTVPAINCTNLEVSLDQRSDPVRYVALPSYPPAPAEWATNLGGAITTVALDYGTTGLSQTADMSDTYFEADLPPEMTDDIDAGLCAFEMNWFGTLHSGDTNDGGRVWAEFLDAGGVQVGERRYDSSAYYRQKLGGEGSQLETRIPDEARKVRMGYRGVRSARETGIVSFYPIGMHGLVKKPAVLPPDPPVAPVVTEDDLWPCVRYLLSSRNGAIENLAPFGSITHTVNGTAQHTVAESRFGDGNNIAFNPAGAASNADYLNVVLPGLGFKTELTLEAWLLKKGNPRDWTGIFNGFGQWNDSASNSLQLHGPVVRPDAPIPYNEWFHLAFCRDADGVCEMFVNGKRQAAVNLSYLTALTTSFTIGRSSSASDNASWYGYIDEFRITDGKRRYTEDFAPPANRFPATGGGAHFLPVLYTGVATSGTNSAAYSHASQPIGAQGVDRHVLVVVANNRANGIAGSPNTVTVAGVGATKIAEFDSSWHAGVHNAHISFWMAPVPTGTTATVAVSYTGNRYRHGIATFWVDGEPELLDAIQGTDSQPSLGTIAVGEGGRVIAVALNSQNVGNYLVVGERHIVEDGTLEVGSDYLNWTGVEPTVSVNLENDATGAFNRFAAISLVAPGG
ncbi:MAG: LamG domain-containing protein [Aquamicrobium sp.]|uniref:LamG-like jellyroll fold domain-containing protein n=1 Tax=Aquamicrobium sp. TaxID=1872579 RepID=UPI00349E7B66|nr:LamG domain-containing protein [Aquamicrobium sp.]